MNETPGVVQGGWPFVVAAYSLTAILLAIYGTMLVTRFRRDSRKDQP